MRPRQRMQATIALLLVCGYLVALGWLLTNPTLQLSPLARDCLVLLGAQVVTAVSYFLGSSAGSARKDEQRQEPPATG